MSREEVMSASTILGGNNRVLLGDGATEAAFKASPLADFRVIHLAVHGVADSEFPDRAALVLGAQAGEDGLLQVREIQDLPIHSELVTLSAYDTGAGRLLGEGHHQPRTGLPPRRRPLRHCQRLDRRRLLNRSSDEISLRAPR